MISDENQSAQFNSFVTKLCKILSIWPINRNVKFDSDFIENTKKPPYVLNYFNFLLLYTKKNLFLKFVKKYFSIGIFPTAINERKKIISCVLSKKLTF